MITCTLQTAIIVCVCVSLSYNIRRLKHIIDVLCTSKLRETAHICFFIIKSFVSYRIKKKPVYNLRRNLIIPIFILLLSSIAKYVTIFFFTMCSTSFVASSRHDVFQLQLRNIRYSGCVISI